MNLLKGIGSALKSVDFLGMAVDAGAQLLGLPPEVASVAKIGIGAATGNAFMIADGAVNLAANIGSRIAVTEYAPSCDPAIAGKGYASGKGKAKGSNKNQLKDCAKHLKVLRDNLHNVDSAGALIKFSDGVFNRFDLVAVANNVRYPEDLRASARYFLTHPDVFREMDVASRVGIPDGLVGLADIESMLDSVQSKIGNDKTPPVKPQTASHQSRAVSSASSQNSSTQGTEAKSSVRDILNDPSLSLEEKISLIMNSLLDNIDSQIEQSMDDLASAQDRIGMKKEESEGNGPYKGETADTRKAEKINQRLQKLIEQRKAMNDLLSNMSTKFAEMNHIAIQNLGRS